MPQLPLQESLHASSRTSRVKIIGRRREPIILSKVTPGRIYGLRYRGLAVGFELMDRLQLDAWALHSSCKERSHLLFFAAPSDSRTINRLSSKE